MGDTIGAAQVGTVGQARIMLRELRSPLVWLEALWIWETSVVNVAWLAHIGWWTCSLALTRVVFSICTWLRTDSLRRAGKRGVDCTIKHHDRSEILL